MSEIVANVTVGLLMILFQEENPLWIITFLRVLIAIAGTGAVLWLLGFVGHEFCRWFGKSEKR